MCKLMINSFINYEEGDEESSTYEYDGAKYSDVKAMQVSNGFFAQNKLALSSGNFFSEEMTIKHMDLRKFRSYSATNIHRIIISEIYLKAHICTRI